MEEMFQKHIELKGLICVMNLDGGKHSKSFITVLLQKNMQIEFAKVVTYKVSEVDGDLELELKDQSEDVEEGTLPDEIKVSIEQDKVMIGREKPDEVKYRNYKTINASDISRNHACIHVNNNKFRLEG